ncbi:hypothetical protein QQS21_000598 [Conoideocrella luteorostrata]|uniref:Major facilitator superfamily (MFS) profile domain-containing protein n=1 Tax=Conoideocrella luteorostrata TaxID=1105319 RepID=A0AAJ0CZQ8_9HYPO|nr:hypothetical protein QQS21_000598 [Conoideocrella luteorostrata]
MKNDKNDAKSDTPSATRLSSAQQPEPVERMSSLRIVGVWLAISCGVACTFLDEGIIATAIPRITDEFRSLSDVGWYGSAYLSTLCAFQLVYGRLYGKFNTKAIYLASLAIFEIGSVLCAASPSSTVFILGRAVAGFGGSGLMSGTIAIFANALPSDGLPLYLGAVGVVYGLAAVLGPVVGGLITNSHLTWRWCFYINLPLSLPPALCALFFVKIQTQANTRPWQRKALELDFLGMILLLPSITCLVLGLEYGNHGQWAEGRTVGCFAAAGALMLLFIVEQWWMGEKALVPPRIFKKRIVLFASLYGFCIESAFLTLVYYIPLWFQAVQDVTAEQSGVRYLPLCAALILTTLGSGWLVTKWGYFQPFMLAGTILVSVGAGLLSTINMTSGSSKWVTYQILAGLGIGASTQQPGVAVQCLLEEADATVGLAVVLFLQNLGPSVMISAANTIFANSLLNGIRRVLPGLDPRTIIESGATGLRQKVAPGDVDTLIGVYNTALTRTFIVAASMAAVSIFGLVGIGLQRIPSAGSEKSTVDEEEK